MTPEILEALRGYSTDFTFYEVSFVHAVADRLFKPKERG